VIPASVAGVKRIAMLTPPMKDGSVYPLTLVSAREAGATEIYRVGGAQAIAAAAFGTESIARVDKITGPGNIFVANAKREVYGYVGIDMIAGPSEVLVVADDSAPANYVAADMLSQAEHDALAQAVLITDSERLAKEVQQELPKQLAALSRSEIAGRSIDDYGTILLCDSIDDGIAAANMVAPEHMELMLKSPFEYLGKVKNAGAIFLGRYSPEPLGDYYAGPNHVLPTSGTARFSSPLSVDDFIKKSSIIYCERDALRAAAEDVEIFAQAEGLGAHARSVAIRFEEGAQ
ncbi:MAG: histidinol dehydrogenase, partial [Christensenellales bacterium]